MHILIVHYVSIVVPSDIFKDFLLFLILILWFLRLSWRGTSLLTDTYLVRSNTTTSHGTNQLFKAFMSERILSISIVKSRKPLFALLFWFILIFVMAKPLIQSSSVDLHKSSATTRVKKVIFFINWEFNVAAVFAFVSWFWCLGFGFWCRSWGPNWDSWKLNNPIWDFWICPGKILKVLELNLAGVFWTTECEPIGDN